MSYETLRHEQTFAAGICSWHRDRPAVGACSMCGKAGLCLSCSLDYNPPCCARCVNRHNKKILWTINSELLLSLLLAGLGFSAGILLDLVWYDSLLLGYGVMAIYWGGKYVQRNRKPQFYFGDSVTIFFVQLFRGIGGAVIGIFVTPGEIARVLREAGFARKAIRDYRNAVRQQNKVPLREPNSG